MYFGLDLLKAQLAAATSNHNLKQQVTDYDIIVTTGSFYSIKVQTSFKVNFQKIQVSFTTLNSCPYALRQMNA